MAAAACTAAALEAAADDLRELDERPLPRADPVRVLAAGLRRDGRGRASHVPDPDQASRTPRQAGTEAAVATERLDGRLDREQAMAPTRRLPAESALRSPVHLR